MTPRLRNSGVRSRARRLVSLSCSCLALPSLRVAALSAGVLAAAVVQAQQPATGVITGHVVNPATGEYMANAEVHVAGTDRVATTDSTGFYRLSDVPAGSATVTVNFTGYQAATATVEVSPGQTATSDFELRATGVTPADVVKLDAFTVSSDREGNAKAIMAQRNSMNITNSVSADVFGATSEGNVGEFLKYMPGVDLEYVEADTRTPRLGGLDPSYTGVTLNGMGMASADAFQQYNGTDNVRAGGGNRSFGFEQVSINSIESIEVNLTTAADQDASSPAGTINLKTKRGFDRRERFIGFSVNAMMNSEDPSFKKTYGPGDRKDYKIKPGANFDYFDAFLNHRLGVALNISESNMYNQQRLTQLGYNDSPTATDPRPHVLNSITFKSGPKFTERFAASLGLDFKATDRLTLSWVSGYQWYDASYYNRQIVISSSSRANVSGDSLTDLRFINDGAQVSYSTGAQATKLTRSFQLSPSFEYRLGNLQVNGAVNYSSSVNQYEALAQRLNARDVPVNNLTGVDFHVSRSAANTVDWTIEQIPGTSATSSSAAKDASNYANFTNPRVVDDGRYNAVHIYQAMLDGKMTFNWALPVTFKAGGKITERSNANDDYTPVYTWNYTGPGGGATGSWADYITPTTFDMGKPTVTFVNLAGQTYSPPFANRGAIANLFYDHPEYFTNGATAANWYSALVGNHRRVREQINAGYFMGSTRWKKLTVQAGIRVEQTKVATIDFDPLSAAQVTAAGYTVDKTGRATTTPGIVYQYMTKPKVENSGSYTNPFPSASAKYMIARNLQFMVGYSHAIRRPNYNDIGGVITIDESQSPGRITIPNPNLKPEMSDNVSARLAYYFEPVGQFSITGTQNTIKNAVATSITPASETVFGVDYPDYEVWSRSNSGGSKKVKSLTFDYRQNVPVPFLKNMTVFANYTRNVVDDVAKYGVPPMMASAGISFRYKRANFGINSKWTQDTPWNFTQGRFRKERIMTDLNLGYSLTKNFQLFASGRNITNEEDYIYNYYSPSYLYKFEHYGSIWTFGVNGKF